MTLFSSLTNRIFLASALLAIATTGVAVYVVGTRATREAEAELRRGVGDAATLVAQQQRALATRYIVFARMLADLPKLKSAVETQDPATVEAIAADYRQQVGADLLLVTGRTGNVLARGGIAASGVDGSIVTDALEGRETLQFRPASARDPAGRHGADLDWADRARSARNPQPRRAARRAAGRGVQGRDPERRSRSC